MSPSDTPAEPAVARDTAGRACGEESGASAVAVAAGDTPPPDQPLMRKLAQLEAEISALRSALAVADSEVRWTQLNRRIDEMFGVLTTLQAGVDAPRPPPPQNDRGIFVVGHARSGTTVLADALNTSNQICCLMEPYLYRSAEVPAFAAAFNAMHRGFNNPPIKGYWVPDFGNASARRVIESLRGTYRYVGEKLSFRQRDKDYDSERFLSFATSEYATSPFACVIRDPICVTSSAIDLFEASRFDPPTIADLVRSQFETYLLVLRLALLVPSCFVLQHERVDAETFALLGHHLDVDLRQAHAVYRANYQRTPHRAAAHELLAADPLVQELRDAHTALIALVDPGTLRLADGRYGDCRALADELTRQLRSDSA
jgi:hypothetical protein